MVLGRYLIVGYLDPYGLSRSFLGCSVTPAKNAFVLASW